MRVFVVTAAMCGWLLAVPAPLWATQIGDFSFIEADFFFDAHLLVQNTSFGVLEGNFTSVEITLVDSSDNEYLYGYDENQVFIAGTPSPFYQLASGTAARFFFGSPLSVADYVGAFVTVGFQGGFVSSCAGSIPTCLLPLQLGDPQPLEFTSVPEPTSILFVAAGCAFLGVGMRRMRSRGRDA
jgi:hypothetical protein